MPIGLCFTTKALHMWEDASVLSTLKRVKFRVPVMPVVMKTLLSKHLLRVEVELLGAEHWVLLRLVNLQ